MQTSPSASDIIEVRKRIRHGVVATPCRASLHLSALTGARIYLKHENLQITSSFKDRGALAKLLSLDRESSKRGVIALSAGNHAQAVASHARRLKVPATIVMPETTPIAKTEKTRRFGAEVLLRGKLFDETRGYTEELARQRNLTLIHPYDDREVIAGQGSVALEMLEEVPNLDALVVPIGGGGLISGMSIIAKEMKPDIRIYGVEASRFASMYRLLKGEGPEFGMTTLAEGIAVKAPGEITGSVIRELVDDILLVDEPAIEQALVTLMETDHTLVEGAGAVGLAAVMSDLDRFQDLRVGLVLTGGNIDPLVLSAVIQRVLARSGRLLRIRMELSDDPGNLGRVCALLGTSGANIVDIEHRRVFAGTSARAVDVAFVLQLRRPEDRQGILNLLSENGFSATPV